MMQRYEFFADNRSANLAESFNRVLNRVSNSVIVPLLAVAGNALSIIVLLVGVVFATGFVNFGEWVSLTVVLVALLTGVLEFTQLKNRVVYINLSIGELRNLLVWWDSLSVVRRRSSAVKAHVVDTTERAILQVVDAQTTAAANAQILVEKQLARTSYYGGSGERESVAEERG